MLAEGRATQTDESSNTRDGTSADSASRTRAVSYFGAKSTWLKRVTIASNNWSACDSETAGLGPIPRKVSLHAPPPTAMTAAATARCGRRIANERRLGKR